MAPEKENPRSEPHLTRNGSKRSVSATNNQVYGARAEKTGKRLNADERFRNAIEATIKEIVQDMGVQDIEFERSAIDIAKEVVEAFAIRTFKNAALCAEHARRVTIKPTDFRMAVMSRVDDRSGLMSGGTIEPEQRETPEQETTEQETHEEEEIYETADETQEKAVSS